MQETTKIKDPLQNHHTILDLTIKIAPISHKTSTEIKDQKTNMIIKAITIETNYPIKHPKI